MKECSKCHRQLEESSFNWKNKQKGKYQSYCSDCQKIMSHNHYLKNSSDYKERSKIRRGIPKIKAPFYLRSGKSGGYRISEKKKIAALHGREYECFICKLKEWLGKEIVLRLDHIDGNKNNGKIENLRLLCPNCDSQQKTYCGRNKFRYASIAQ